MSYSINANIKGWLGWLDYYLDEKEKGLPKYKTITANIKDLGVGMLKDLLLNYDCELNHETVDTDRGDFTESYLSYKVLRPESEIAEHNQDCDDSYQYWINKVNKVMDKEPKYKLQVTNYLNCINKNYEGLKL